jgi:type II secretory pathway pseudopilin PulG
MECWSAASGSGSILQHSNTPSLRSAFTMIEIAISLGIIAIALVAIIGILPKGLNTQKENREDTILNQDGPFFLEAIRNGAQGLDHLTNYVEWIQTSNSLAGARVFYDGRQAPPPLPPGTQDPSMIDGRSIIGLLTTPRIVGTPPNLSTNYVTAFVRSLSGAAVEQGKAAKDFSFGYLLISEIITVPTIHQPIDNEGRSNEVRQLVAGNFHDIRLTFRWPVKPNFEATGNRKVFRAVVGGSVAVDGDRFFVQPQHFVPAP